MSAPLTRRRVLTGTIGLAGGLLAGCDRLSDSESFRRVLATAEAVNFQVQRLLLGNAKLAREFSAADVSPVFRANGTTMPGGEAYRRMLQSGFREWRLRIDGLVRQPLALSLDELRRLPSRTQITRHDCVEGWSCIGQWTGVPLGLLLRAAGLRPEARYLVFHCADELEPAPNGLGLYYESIDRTDAFHPQTILAYAMNGMPLTPAHGAPLRLRVERQLGYKMAKYVMRIEATDRLDHIGGGKGGFWEDRGYAWYAGI